MTIQTERFECWAIVELFGHQRMAGRMSEATVGGGAFVRVDVPSGDGFTTRLLGSGAIYAINIVDEAIAREAASRFRWRPVYGYDLPRLIQDEAPDYSEVGE